MKGWIKWRWYYFVFNFSSNDCHCQTAYLTYWELVKVDYCLLSPAQFFYVNETNVNRNSQSLIMIKWILLLRVFKFHKYFNFASQKNEFLSLEAINKFSFQSPLHRTCFQIFSLYSTTHFLCSSAEWIWTTKKRKYGIRIGWVWYLNLAKPLTYLDLNTTGDLLWLVSFLSHLLTTIYLLLHSANMNHMTCLYHV